MSVSAAPSVSVQEAARRARVDERTVRRWISSGRLRAARTRHGWRINPVMLTTFLAESADTTDGAGADPRATAADMPEAPAAMSEAPPAPSALDVALAT